MMFPKQFKDRREAGLQLADALRKYSGQDVVVLAVPRGGLPIGAMIARELGVPMDIALSKKIGHPYNPEYAIGAVTIQDRIINEGETVSESYIEEETRRIRDELKRRYQKYHKDREPVALRDKIVILTDDGIATGNTVMVLTSLIRRQQPEKIVVAIPVAPPSAIQKLKECRDIDEVVCLLTPDNFNAVGQYYRHFYQVSDEEAIQWLTELTEK